MIPHMKKTAMPIVVLMRVVIILLLCMVVLLIAGGVQSQVIHCADLTKSTVDTIRVVSFSGKPGAEVMMPLRMKNDSIVRAFSMQIIFDTSFLTPVLQDIQGDTTALKWDALGRFRQVTTVLDSFGFPHDSVITKLSVNLYTDPDGNLRKNIINCNFLPAANDIDTLPPGGDVIFGVFFTAKPTLVHNTVCNFNFYAQDEYQTDNSVFPPVVTFVGCRQPQESQAWTNQQGTTDDITAFPTFPASSMVFRVDTSAVQPAFTSFGANPSSFGTGGGSTTLSWVATNTDSVVVTRPTAPTRVGSGGATGSINNVSVTATTTFTATAYGGGNQVTQTTTVTVGTTPGNQNPVVNSSVVLDSVNEGQTISFTVTATDNDPVGGSITLAAQNMPAGASFPTQVNVASVTGTFNWTPNVGQKGTYQITFTATDQSAGVGTRTVTVVVVGLEFDRLFSTSAPPPDGRPVGGLRGTNEVFFPVNLVSSKTVYGIQYDMTYPYQLIHIDSIVLSGRIPDYAVYDNIGVTPGSIRVVTFGLNNEPVATDTTTAIMWLVVTLDSSGVPWTSATMRLANGRESVDPNPNVASLPLVTDSGIIEFDNAGDVNIDHYIDVGDVVNIVAYIIGNYPLTRRQFATADVIRNGAVDVFDLVGDINLIYGIPPTPTPAPVASAIVSLNYENMSSGQSENLTVTSELPTEVAGVQLDVAYDPRAVELGKPVKTADYKNFNLQYKDNGQGKMTILLYHGAGAMASVSDLIQIGTADLVSIPMTARQNVAAGNKSQLRLSKALLATPTAAAVTVEGVDPSLPYSFNLKQNYPNPFNPTTTIEFSVGAQGNGAGLREVTLEIFNVVGQKVKTLLNEKLPAGEHRIVWNATNENGARVASGIYLYRLRVDAESQTRKMVFLK